MSRGLRIRALQSAICKRDCEDTITARAPFLSRFRGRNTFPPAFWWTVAGIAGGLPCVVGLTLWSYTMYSLAHPGQEMLYPGGTLGISYDDLADVAPQLAFLLKMGLVVGFTNLAYTGVFLCTIIFFGIRARERWAWYCLVFAVAWIGGNDARAAYLQMRKTGFEPFLFLPFVATILGTLGVAVSWDYVFHPPPGFRERKRPRRGARGLTHLTWFWVIVTMISLVPIEVGLISWAHIAVSLEQPAGPIVYPGGRLDVTYAELEALNPKAAGLLSTSLLIGFVNLVSTGFFVGNLVWFGVRLKKKWAWAVVMMAFVWIGINDMRAAYLELARGAAWAHLMVFPFLVTFLGGLGMALAGFHVFRPDMVDMALSYLRGWWDGDFKDGPAVPAPAAPPGSPAGVETGEEGEESLEES